MRISTFLLISSLSFALGVQFPVMDAEELIKYWNYPYENHWVETDDGFVLYFQRIGNTPGNPDRPVIYLQHGLFGSSARFTAGPPHQVIIIF